MLNCNLVSSCKSFDCRNVLRSYSTEGMDFSSQPDDQKLPTFPTQNRVEKGPIRALRSPHWGRTGLAAPLSRPSVGTEKSGGIGKTYENRGEDCPEITELPILTKTVAKLSLFLMQEASCLMDL